MACNRDNMRTRLIFFTFLVALSFLLIVAGQEQEGSDRKELEPSARSRFVLPKIFDFGLFKKLFNKHYGSLVQELARQKLFLARAFEAFVSAVSYKHYKSDYYLGINQMSDQTDEEMEARMIKRTSHDHDNDAREDSTGSDVDSSPLEAADLKDVERELSSIIEQTGGQAGLKEAAEELNKLSGQSRRRRRADDARDASLEDLIIPQQFKVNNDKIVRNVASNNPNYEPPELMSQGAGDEKVEQELPETETNLINKFPGSQFLDAMKDKLISTFTGQEEVSGVGNLDESFDIPDGQAVMGQSRPAKVVEPDEVFVDHRQSNCFFPARDQGNCGSCYIFSTVALFEWAYCMKTGQLVAFSEQYPIDCGFRAGLPGCQGDYEKNVVKFVMKYGLELQKNYPYRANEGTCPYSRDMDHKRMGYLRVKDAKLKAVGIKILEKHLKLAPMVGTIKAIADFGKYKGGVHPGKECKPEGEHSMLLVGHGRQGGKEYWLFRNSYNSDWGEEGYFKLAKTSPCFIQKETQTFQAGYDEVYQENDQYERFELLKEHMENRDPDAPNNAAPIAGPVNNGQ